MKNVDHIISFVCVKEMLKPMRSLVSCLQGNFRFKKAMEIIHIYKETLEKADQLFQSIYAETVCLAKEFHVEEKWSQSCG